MDKYLEQTIQSVLNQNYPNLEYIVIDGGSKDRSVDIIKKYANKLAYWVSEPDKGIYDALQKGLNKCTGEIMAWINSDDMYHANAFFSVAEIFSNYPKIAWLRGASTTYDEQGRTVNVSKGRMFSKYEFYAGDFKWIQQESVFWRRSLWQKSGQSLAVKYKYAADLALWMIFFKYENLYVCDALFGGFRARSGNQLSLDNLGLYLAEANDILKNIQLTSKEKFIVNIYKLLLTTCKLLEKIKIINTEMLLNTFRKIVFKTPRRISFNRSTQKFVN
jgi:glycosyltransferase involved in cell wall biosynthesis